jgi:superfamily I DNA and RNA helicase
MKWVLPDIATRTVTVAYRQSRQLHNLARQLVVLSGGSEDDAILPAFTENDGVPPVLAKDMASLDIATLWLAERIIEIEGFVGELPSIAVLVNSENEVRPVAAALSDALIEHNISVEACLDGRARGRDGAVRVFNVQHIKGLEFEAVFFVGVDRLAERHPDLFDKYLYVGATRAATYLGLTCEGSLPPRLTSLEGSFRRHWL